MINISTICPSFAISACNSIDTWLGSHYWIGWLVSFLILLCLFVNYLFDTIPKFQQFKAEILIPRAKKRDHGRKVKAAIKADIESRVNGAIMHFDNKLPSGWINKMKINWVEKESREDFFNEGEMVLRIRPLSDQTANLVRASHAFLEKAFFPHVKKVIPKEHREASVLFTGRKIMSIQGDHVKNLYEDTVLEPAISKSERILPIMNRYEELDKHGFFMGAFLREIQAVATGARFDAIIRKKNAQRSFGFA